MTSLTVWKFDTPEGAGQALTKLEGLSKQQLVTIEDAAIVYWEAGKSKPKTHQAHSMAGAGALGGAFWACCLDCCSLFRSSGWRLARLWAR